MRTHKFKYVDDRGERANAMPELNRSALAREAGISRSQLSRILNGRIEPPVETLRKIAVAMDATMDETDAWLRRLRGRAKAGNS